MLVVEMVVLVEEDVDLKVEEPVILPSKSSSRK